ncbi:MAG: glutamine-hydrolyzing GMP synthase [Candidatus Levybacteria bacterium]|nr:glutamine-hydrolyzing GMP synthase [Candidatus Levybacteria bacterium]
MILLVDFGSQTAHLIARRLKTLGANVAIVTPEEAFEKAKALSPQGIVFSGGPQSVYAEGAPTVDKEIFTLNIPILAICYGFQLVAYLLGGKVIGEKREYGPATLHMTNSQWPIAKNIPNDSTVWMSHGDAIEELPEGYAVIGTTEHVPYAFAKDEKKKITGILFHPEVEHTQYGKELLQNFLDACGVIPENVKIDIEKIVDEIQVLVKDAYVIGAISGGVDSTVAGALTAKAIGDHFVPMYVENGLMRETNRKHVKAIFEHFGIKAAIVDCEEEMLKRLKGLDDPEEKRKAIGKFYIDIFEGEMEKYIKAGKDIRFLMQGTIYSDVIESKGTKHADKIKSHHNVGGLPEKMKLRLLEPVREYYKDEVRQIGALLGLPKDFISKQPFPGPGYGVRIRGEVTKERLAKEKHADRILLEELEKADVLQKVFISFPVMTGANSVAVKGDGRFFGEVIALRIVESQDVMTATWARIPYEVLQRISSRIVNEVIGISRVVYDISTKPPATMEWE